MKMIVVWMLLLWGALNLQVARPDLFDTGTLVMPLAVGCLFWLRTGTGVLLAGVALLIQWILNTTVAPLDMAVILLPACLAISQGRRTNHGVPQSRTRLRHGWWVQPVVILCMGLAVQALLRENGQTAQLWPGLLRSLCAALPVLALSLLLSGLAEQFGFRRLPVW